MFKFADVVRPEHVLVGMKSRKKEDAFGELAELLVRSGVIPDREALLRGLRSRERLGSTNFGRGIAVPHSKCPQVDRAWLIVGTANEGIDWGVNPYLTELPPQGVANADTSSIAFKPELVDLVFLIVSHPDRPGDHVRTLETLTRALLNDHFCRFLRQSRAVDEVLELLQEWDEHGPY